MKTGLYRYSRHDLVFACVLIASLFCLWNQALATPKYSVPLTLEDRVQFQRAIEQVYYNHRIWPKENPSAKPPLDVMMPEASLRTKVEDSLKKSNALAEDWRQPITPAQLQAEMNRMARSSKSPEVLRELFAALGNDPYLIAECLARPILADRLIHNWYAFDSRFHGDLKQQAESELMRFGSSDTMRNLSGQYSESEWVLRQNNDPTAPSSNPSIITLDPEQWKEWTADLRSRFAAGQIPTGVLSPLKEDKTAFSVTTVLESQPGRIRVAAVRWPKQPFDAWWSQREASLPAEIAADPAVYNAPAITATVCTDDTWTSTTTSAPTARINYTAVWTGSQMIVWGGEDAS